MTLAFRHPSSGKSRRFLVGVESKSVLCARDGSPVDQVFNRNVLRFYSIMRLIIFGPPGAGKGTQAQFIAERFHIPHISTGNIFRDNIARSTPLGLEAQRFLDAGNLVPDSLTNEMVADYLGRPDNRQGFLLDGYPRTVQQATFLDGALARYKTTLDGVINLLVPDSEILDRLVLRGRTDDTIETIRHRLGVYHSTTAPLMELYRKRNILFDVNGVGPIEEIRKLIITSFNHRIEG